MKTISSLALLFVVVFFTTLTSSDTVSTKFLPLKVGNVWTYVRTGGWPPYAPPVYYKCTVQRDTLVNGHRFYYLSNSEQLYSPGQHSNWFRIDSADGKLINFGPDACSGSNFYLIDSLSSGINDLCKICPNDTLLKRRLLTAVSSVRWGVQTFVLNFNWNTGPAVFSRTYSKYFGLTFSSYGEIDPLVYTLRGCIIDGILYGDTNTFVGINQLSSEIPVNFELQQNYPNPFNPITHFGFRIADFGLVRLTVFDAIGREIEVLVNQQLQPGTYEVNWDASNYPSGVYYYRLEAGDPSTSLRVTDTKKMVLVK